MFKKGKPGYSLSTEIEKWRRELAEYIDSLLTCVDEYDRVVKRHEERCRLAFDRGFADGLYGHPIQDVFTVEQVPYEGDYKCGYGFGAIARAESEGD